MFFRGQVKDLKGKFNMKIIWILVLVVFYNGLCLNGVTTNVSTRPDSVTIGAILSVNSTIGKVAKVAIEAAINDVNSDPSVLGGTKLRLKMQDTNYSGFMGMIECTFFIISFLFIHGFFVSHFNTLIRFH